MRHIQWGHYHRLLARTMSSSSNKTIILCPGQGSQYVGMLQNVDEANKLISAANDALGYDLHHLCKHGPKDVLDR